MSCTEDIVKHLARLTQQLRTSTSCNNLGSTQSADAQAISQSSSINNARYSAITCEIIFSFTHMQAHKVWVQLGGTMQKIVELHLMKRLLQVARNQTATV